MMNISVLAAEPRKNPLGGAFSGIGPLGEFDFTSPTDVFNLFNKVISNIVGVMTVIAGLWFIFQFIIGAFGYLTSGGDKAKAQEAQQKITMAVIGLVVVIAAIFIIDLVGALLGLEILRPGKFILNMWPGGSPPGP